MLEDPVPLSLDEHMQLARERRASEARWRQLSQMVADVYGHESPCAFTFRKTIALIEHLRQQLQRQASQDLPAGSAEGLYV